jgi:hypothetical protein
MTDDEILKALKKVVCAQAENYIASLRESIAEDEAAGQERIVRYWREQLATAEARLESLKSLPV